MNTPVNRMAEHDTGIRTDAAICYVVHCIKRNFPDDRVTTVHREPIVDNKIDFGITMDWSDQGFIVRFRVPIESSGSTIKVLCQDASLVMLDMLAKAGMKVK